MRKWKNNENPKILAVKNGMELKKI